ncbi:DUF4129 domain-containing protein [Deinococcus sp. Marseille-Q6407]|uniref:DUF4129 domain-containing protein n=1 Tax=Deinococcus sp. Marseille-Q6407 TaxID=2969223 RepID=UPI0021C095A8|nr:DUF4129 domain-containing protein [Deinococcus sp. Marseille-Q6407]
MTWFVRGGRRLGTNGCGLSEGTQNMAKATLAAEQPAGGGRSWARAWWLAGVMGLALLVVFFLRRHTKPAAPPAPTTRASVSSPPASAFAAPLHRVRAAYARTEAHLSAAGLSRREAETPAEYLRRVAAEWPGQAAPLATLGAAYGPVRYGGGVTDAQAEAAEGAAALILAGAPPAAPVSSSEHSAADRSSSSERQGPA